ncbi:MAG TPA: hypothetical protein VNT52_09840 [Acidimicrobiales bacterium]|nr:hypothetical protein [Acidimicrobiales bacterium]
MASDDLSQHGDEEWALLDMVRTAPDEALDWTTRWRDESRAPPASYLHGPSPRPRRGGAAA